ncbi:ParB N-terminal domain-containing protein [Leucobacter manosquensis]|uniref:ParB N-terminal domain-containing protein n=1 Tax=Leucobacter manosquensis TaxID=2810611 RepID=A0ABS5M574_9MICO|nr:ParB N-terminal domain-containing protein [Leucobacter manosquensis]MBS3182347.1 ParB N-terminal domain-containing protein [Leucobacter manosquensis]
MTKALLPDTVEIRHANVPTTQIVIRKRQREIDPKHVEILRQSVRETGKQIVPIALSEQASGALVLIDGAHRLEAAKKDDRDTIRAEIYTNLTEDLEGLLELRTNRERKNLTPAEILQAWETFDLPLFEEKARKKQSDAASAMLSERWTGDDSLLTPNRGKQSDAVPLSIRQAAKESTGYNYEAIQKIATIRDLAESETAPPEVREVAKMGFEKLHRVGAKIEPVLKEVMKTSEAIERRSEDPEVAKLRAAEKRLDDTVSESTLLQEKLENSDFRDVLTLAAQKDQMARESLRAIRVALVNALSTIVVVECTVDGDVSQSLQRIGGEVTNLLSSQSFRQLGLEDRRG